MKIFCLFIMLISLLSSCTDKNYLPQRCSRPLNSGYRETSDNFKSEAYLEQNWNYNDKKWGGFEKLTKDEEPKKDIENGRMVIYNAWITLVVKDPDSTAKKMYAIAKRFDGYVQTEGTDRCVIRVKSTSLDNTILALKDLGKITYRNVSGEDVTDAYKDDEIRLDNATKARQRYLELLAKAANVTETLLVEKELERLSKEIELYKGRMERMKHLTEFSTITISLQKKVKPGIIGYVGIGIYEVLKWFFVRN